MRKDKRAGLLCLALFALFAFCAVPSVQAQNDSVAIPGAPTVDQEPRIHVNEVSSSTRDHSPGRALLLSAVLPGAGQVYNRQAWKIPIIYAALGGMAYYTYYNYTYMKQFKDEYLYRVNHDGAAQLAGYTSYPTSNIYNLYESYNQTFQLSIIISAAIYGLNLLDAYVFGHLFDFQIDDDLTLQVAPLTTPLPQGGLAAGAGITLRL